MISADFKDTNLKVGDTVQVHSTVIEGVKSRIQVFEGVLIRFSGRDVNRTFTVRRVGVTGQGVERIWPLNARSLVKIEVKKNAKHIRRSKLYFIRSRTGRLATSV